MVVPCYCNSFQSYEKFSHVSYVATCILAYSCLLTCVMNIVPISSIFQSRVGTARNAWEGWNMIINLTHSHRDKFSQDSLSWSLNPILFKVSLLHCQSQNAKTKCEFGKYTHEPRIKAKILKLQLFLLYQFDNFILRDLAQENISTVPTYTTPTTNGSPYS